MPRYKIGGQIVRRKNHYMPCAIAAEVDGMSDEEYAETMKKTYWADLITNTEWPVVLGHEDCSPSAKSRLKKKAAGWLMALGRIAYLNPDLHREIVKQAEEMYRDQIGENHPFQWEREVVEQLCEILAERQRGELDSTNGQA
jgi:hypothetical protein